MRRCPAALLACAVLVVAAPARADRVAEAEDLFRRGKAMMNDGKNAEACPLLQESQKLDPATGTLLNLALCHEAVGKIATAWGEFRAVEQQSRAQGRQDRIDLAREHANKLEPRLSRLKIVVPPEARTPGLVVKVDGDEKGEPSWSGVPVDPGTHHVEHGATGKKPRRHDIKVDDEASVATVTLARLEDAPIAVAPKGGTDLEEVERYAAARARRTTGFVVGGIGLATMTAGLVFGVLAISADQDAQDQCATTCFRGEGPATASNQATDRAFVFANVANVLVPLGLVATGIGTYLVLTAGPTERKSSANALRDPRRENLSVTPLVGPGVQGAALTGRF